MLSGFDHCLDDIILFANSTLKETESYAKKEQRIALNPPGDLQTERKVSISLSHQSKAVSFFSLSEEYEVIYTDDVEQGYVMVDEYEKRSLNKHGSSLTS